MLPFDRKPWAKTVARIVIAATLLGIAVAWIIIRKVQGSLDTGEYLAFILIALAIIPTNLAVIYRKEVAEVKERLHEQFVHHES